jgi:hypothetical protein
VQKYTFRFLFDDNYKLLELDMCGDHKYAYKLLTKKLLQIYVNNYKHGCDVKV